MARKIRRSSDGTWHHEPKADKPTQVTVGCGCFLFLLAMKISFFLFVIWLGVRALQLMGAL